MSFSQTAMLVSLNVRCYSARKEDKRISREVAETHNTKQDAGRYNKVLIPKRYLEPVTKAAGAIRTFHYENTLPWLDDGIRVLPSAHFHDYKAGVTILIDGFDSATRDIVRDWQPIIIPDAKRELNGLFNASDYPTDIATRFGCGLRFMPIPDSSDFRVAIADLERETLRSEIADTLSAASQNAMGELWSRVSVAVSTMATKLSAYQPGNKEFKAENPFRDSLVENLRDLCQLLPRLNFTNDPKLESVRMKIEAELLQVDAADLRESDMLRQRVAERADKIAADIAEFMG